MPSVRSYLPEGFHDKGKVALEEAYLEPDQVNGARGQELASHFAAPSDTQRWIRQIQSITGERIELSNKHGIGYTVLSMSGPACQMIVDKDEAEMEASRANDWIYNQIKDHRDRFGAFAMLSMHDPVQAGEELRRCVTQLGFHGALLYNVQHAGHDASTWLFYDQPQYDAFWKVCCELDVPVYIHPSLSIGYPDEILHKLYSGRKYLVGPPASFGTGVALHLLGLVINGVFDRFPNLKIIVGHLGERIPFDFWRTNHWIQDVMKPQALENGDVICEQDDIVYYFKRNIWFTTSGHFHTPTLKYVCDYLGADRILFSVDYPYETIERACEWWDGDAEEIMKAVGGEEAYYRIGRENAKKLLKLDTHHDCDA